MRIPIDKIKELMQKASYIRNVGVVAHVDHGKSTLSDVILSEAGFISKDLAGKLLYLDYLEEEQKRGITIKTSSITTILRHGSREYLLNLIDTPGHVDFSGKVTRALRLMDGAILVVDAVEGVMSQTEHVLSELVREKVKPILFINKLDRLIREMNFSTSQIQAQLEDIIIKYNELVRNFAKDEYKYYLVNPSDETVVFGSALYKWGFTVKTALENKIKFDDIVDLVKKDVDSPSKMFPLGKLISRLIYEKLPNPREAQKNRIPSLWEGTPPTFLLNCESQAPTVIYVSKVQYYSGRLLCTVRVFSGKATPGVYKQFPSGRDIRIHSVGLLLGSRVNIVREIPAGNIGGLITSQCEIGSTLADADPNGHFKKPSYKIVPVIYVAITPIYPREFDKLLKMLEEIKLEEQNIGFEINKDTGQIILWGIGELQLELIVKKIQEEVKVYTSEPLVSYKEVPTNSVSEESEHFHVAISPIGTEKDSGELENTIKLIGFPKSEEENIKSLVLSILRTGPLIGEPIAGTRIIIKNKKKESANVNISELMDVIMKALVKLKTEISEPYYKFDIITKPEYMGAILNEITRRGGKIEDVLGEEKDTISIRGILPVRTALGLPSTIREISHGNAYIQLFFYRYMIAEEKAKESILEELKRKKGLV